jgi:hypothetical protein
MHAHTRFCAEKWYIILAITLYRIAYLTEKHLRAQHFKKISDMQKPVTVKTADL